MKKVNITKITFIIIDCPHCDKSFKVFVDGNWKDIKEMKVSDDKRLMFACPFCDDVLIDETDFSSICSDKDEEQRKAEEAAILKSDIEKRISKDLMDYIHSIYDKEKQIEREMPYKWIKQKDKYDDYSKYWKRLDDIK